MQGLFRSYRWRQIARRIRIARDAAVDIERVFRGHMAFVYYRYISSRFKGARGLQRIGRGWRVRRRVRNLKSGSAITMQRWVRGHMGRNRVRTLRSSVRRHLVETPTVALMRACAVQPDCTWLTSRVLRDIHFMNDAFASDTVVSESLGSVRSGAGADSGGSPTSSPGASGGSSLLSPHGNDINLGPTSLAPKDAQRIGAMLYKNRTTRTLILSRGAIGDNGVKAIASALRSNDALRTLAIGPHDITEVGADALAATFMNHNYSLRHLCLDGNPQIGGRGCASLLKACGDFFARNYGQLQRLTLSNCGMNDNTCAVALGDLVYMNKRLVYLDVSGNKLADKACAELAKGIRNNAVLLGLDMRGNMIRSQGAQSLASALQESHDEVDGRGNGSRNGGSSSSSNNNYSEERDDNFREDVSEFEAMNGRGHGRPRLYNHTLQILRLDCNIVLDDGVRHLLGAFRSSPALKVVSLAGNPIGSVWHDICDEITALREAGIMGDPERTTTSDEVGVNDSTLSSPLSFSSVQSSLSSTYGSGGGGGLQTSVGRGRGGQHALPRLHVSPTDRQRREALKHIHSKPYVPTHLSDGHSVLPHPPRPGRAADRAGVAGQGSQTATLSVDSIIPPELRHAYVSLSGLRQSTRDPLPAIMTAPVTYPSPSVPQRLFRRRGAPRVRPRHTAKPAPNVFLAMVSPPAMHVNPIHSIDQSLIRTQPRHLVSRIAKSQGRNIYGGATW